MHKREAVKNSMKLLAPHFSCFFLPVSLYLSSSGAEGKHMVDHVVGLLQSCDAIGSHMTVLARFYKPSRVRGLLYSLQFVMAVHL